MLVCIYDFIVLKKELIIRYSLHHHQNLQCWVLFVIIDVSILVFKTKIIEKDMVVKGIKEIGNTESNQFHFIFLLCVCIVCLIEAFGFAFRV